MTLAELRAELQARGFQHLSDSRTDTTGSDDKLSLQIAPAPLATAGGMTPKEQASMHAEDIPAGYCQCGCGQKTGVYKWTNYAKGQRKGEPCRFLKGHVGKLTALPRWERKSNALEPMHVALARARGAKWAINPETECWEWLGPLGPYGYGLDRRVGGNSTQAHRNVYQLHRGDPGDTLDHLCRNRACVNPWHLETTTRGENSRRGAASTLTWDAVTEIRESSAPNAELAMRFGVAKCTISQVRNGRTWPESARPEAA